MPKKKSSTEPEYVTKQILADEFRRFKEEMLEDMRAMHDEFVGIINDNFIVFREQLHESKVTLVNHETRISNLEGRPKEFRLIKPF